MNRIVRLTERDLSRLVKRVISEQLAVSQNVQQGRQAGLQSGIDARKAVNTAISDGTQAVAKAGKQVLITIGKVVITVIIIAGATLFLIGAVAYKVTQAIGNAIIKFASATGRAVVSQTTALKDSSLIALKKAGILVDKGTETVIRQINNMKDSSAAVIRYVIKRFQQFGAVAYGGILMAAAKATEINSLVRGYIKQEYDAIAGKLGATYDQAMSGAKALGQKAVGAASSLVNQAKSTASNFANKIGQKAGNTLGAIQGFLQEFFERYNSFTGTNTLSILSESRKFNGMIIL